MQVKQLYTNCLAQGAYYIESNGEVAIIDPLRETKPYMDLATQRGAKIKYILETHFHADFVSGHIDLSNKTGAQVIYGPTQVKFDYNARAATDGEILELGNVKIKVIHTPGHTMESSCFLLIDENGKENSIFTGDTLFIGDVGRPDLAQKVNAELKESILAAHLYDSLHNKIMPLNDELIVYPAHGAGSACGKNLSKETSDTLGNQKKLNYALDSKLTKEEFITKVLDGLTPPPAYFPANVLMNIGGYTKIDEVISRGTTSLDINRFQNLMAENDVIVLDTRKAEKYAQAHIPNAINIGINGDFAVWVGTVIHNINQQMLIVCEPGREEEIVTRLARVGYDYALGYLAGGMDTWLNNKLPIDTVTDITVEEFIARHHADPKIEIVDVRRKSEYDSEHIIGAISAPLNYFKETMKPLDKNKTYYVHCAGGYRSMIFISLLKTVGFTNLINVDGGFNAIKNSKEFTFTEYVCPSTML